MSAIRPPAAVLAAALLAWIPAAQAGTTFSIILGGGHGVHHDHFHGKRYGYYNGHRREHFRHYLGPRHYYYRHGGPYWRPWHSYRSDRHYYRWTGPQCIYRYGYRYCR